MRLSVAVAVVCLSVVGLSIADPSQASIKRPTNIPAQELGSALKALAKDRNLQVVYVTEEISGRRTSGAVGQFTADEAFKQLLTGTGLSFKYLDDKTIAITTPDSTSSSSPKEEREKGKGESSGDAARQQGGSFWDRFRLAQADRGASEEAAAVGSEKSSSSQKGGKSSAVELEEVIVTSTKRAQNVKEIPLSVTVISADEISQRQLVNAEDYLRGIPGVNQVAQPVDGAGIVIRGLETSPIGQNFASGPTVATYFGETPTTNSGSLSGGANVDIRLVDIDRVEVLRGPQGTAFGSSSIGGAVRVIPASPKTDRLQTNIAAGYSNTGGFGGDNHMIQGMANIPLIMDRLALRAVAYRFTDSGYYRNNAATDPAIQSLAQTYGVQSLATARNEEVGATGVTGGRASLLFQATDDLRVTVSYLTQKSVMDGLAESDRPGYTQALLYISPPARGRDQRNGLSDTQIDLFNTLVEYHFSWADLVATYSHISSGSQWIASWSDPSTSLPISNPATSAHHERNGEVRLVSKLDGPINFLAGLYAEKLEDAGLWTYYWDGTPSLNPFDAGQEGLFSNYHDHRALTQRAAFGEVSWKFWRAFTLTGGARYYKYDRTVQVDAGGGLFGDTHTDDSAASSGTTGRASLSYQPSSNVNLYASWAQGFRLGKPQPGLPPSLCDRNNDGIVDGTSTPIASTKELKSDNVNSFEIGSKLSLLDRRLNLDAAIFHINWSGVPFFVYAPPQPLGCGLAYNANAGKAASDGIELQSTFQVTSALRMDGGFSRIHARLTEDAPSLGGVAGDRLPGSPAFNANLGLQYAFNLSDYETTVRADTIYVGPFYSLLQQTSDTRAGDYVKVDLSARVARDRVSADFYVHNLTDARQYTWRGSPISYLMRPRTVGVQLAYAF